MMASNLIFAVFIVDARIIICVAHPLQQGRFACISSANDQNPEVSIFLAEFYSVNIAHCRSVCWCVEGRLCSFRPDRTGTKWNAVNGI